MVWLGTTALPELPMMTAESSIDLALRIALATASCARTLRVYPSSLKACRWTCISVMSLYSLCITQSVRRLRSVARLLFRSSCNKCSQA